MLKMCKCGHTEYPHGYSLNGNPRCIDCFKIMFTDAILKMPFNHEFVEDFLSVLEEIRKEEVNG